jgi:O-antigen ligase
MGIFRVLWLGPLGLFAFAMAKTGSRGGFLALVAGLAVFLRFRVGWTRTLLLGALGLPVLLVAFAGRMTTISTQEETGQERIQLWSEALEGFKSSPVFGIGKDEFAKAAGHVAHNSYVHAFAELGFFGGTVYLGAYFVAVWGLYRLGARGVQIHDPELRRLHPYLLGAVVAYAVGMFTLTLCYVLPTYLVLALAAVYINQAATTPPVPPLRCDARLAGLVTAASVGVLAFIYVFTRMFVRFA